MLFLNLILAKGRNWNIDQVFHKTFDSLCDGTANRNLLNSNQDEIVDLLNILAMFELST